MVKKISVLSFTIILCICLNCCLQIESEKELFVLDINTDNLNEIFAILAYTGSDPVKLRCGSVVFSLYDGNDNMLASSFSNAAIWELDITEGYVRPYRMFLNGSPEFEEEFFSYSFDKNYNLITHHNFTSGDYKIVASFQYGFTNRVDLWDEIETATYIHIP